MNQYKNYGLRISDTPDPQAYRIGGTVLPKIILQKDSDWSNYLPLYEPQFGDDWDTYGCTVWGTENVIEILLKKITSFEFNFSERFPYILANITPPGADPHYVAEVIRKNGLIDQLSLPMTKTYEEFITPKPMTEELLAEGKKWTYELQHEYIWQTPQTEEQQKNLIKEYLKYSPLGITVTAWVEENGVYIDRNLPNTHWVVCYGMNDKGYLIFDSYDHSNKVLSFKHHISICKRYQLIAKKKQSWWLPRLIYRLFN